MGTERKGRQPVLDAATGAEVTADEARDALFEPQYIDFEYGGKKFQCELDRMQLRADIGMQYESVKGRIYARGKTKDQRNQPGTLAERRAQREANRAAREEDWVQREEKPTSVGLQQIAAIADGAAPDVVTGPATPVKGTKKPENEDEEVSAAVMEAFAEGLPEMYALQLQFFVPAITWWNVPAPASQDPTLGEYMVLNNETFKMKEVGRYCIKALADWYDSPPKSPEGEVIETTLKADSKDSANSTTQTAVGESETPNSSLTNSPSSTVPEAPPQSVAGPVTTSSVP